MEFDLPKHDAPHVSSIIKVIGVGGGGSNAVNHMYLQGIVGVDFIVCNTDCQALDLSPVPNKIQLGPNLTEGRGAGMVPDVGMNAAMENIQEIRELLSKDTKMVFVTAGMGGGTGTGAAPVIAQVAKDLGILTVGIVTVPFNFEGRKRRQQAQEGLERMRENVDTLLVINNERLREFGKNMSLSEAFSYADDVLTVAAKGIAEVISVTGAINVDFNDVNTVMRNSGHAIMGSASAAGDDRAVVAVKNALTSPLLYDNDINGARYVLLNITYGSREVMMDEITEITDYIQEAAGSTADVIWGHGHDASLGDNLSLTIIATGFSSSPINGFEKSPERTVVVLEEEKKQEITTPLVSPFESKLATPTELNQQEPFIKQVETPLANPLQAQPIDAEPVNAKTTFNLYDEKEEASAVSQTSMSWEVFDIQADTAHAQPQPSSTAEPEISSTQQTSSAEQEIVKHVLEDESVVRTQIETPTRVLSPEEQQRKAHERVSRIQELTSKLQKPDGLLEFENEPAFVRRNIQIKSQTPSAQDNISRFGVSTDANGQPILRNTNNFLHDNVD
jgi:cell division protein FtsZ